MASLARVSAVLILPCLALVQAAVFLPSETCRPRPTIVNVDPSNHSYLPYFVTLNRCGGSLGAVKPTLKTCVASEETFVNVSVIRTDGGRFAPTIIGLSNHTACKESCVKSETDCDLRYQTWDSHSCTCKCSYEGEPAQSPCVVPLAWNQPTCSCQCPQTARSCPSNKEWRVELCGCACKTSFSLRCARVNYVLNATTCDCLPPPTVIVPITGGSSSRTGSGSDVSYGVVIVIVVVELLVIIGVVLLVMVLKARKKDKAQNGGGSFWSTASRPQRWFIKRKNAYHVDAEPRIEEGTVTPTEDEAEGYGTHDEDYMKSERDSSEAEIFYESHGSHGWHAETDRLSVDSMRESEDARTTQV